MLNTPELVEHFIPIWVSDLYTPTQMPCPPRSGFLNTELAPAIVTSAVETW